MTGQCEKSSLGRSGINREIRYETTWDATTETAFTWRRNADAIAAEAALDGLYIVRTSVPATELDAEHTVRAYKGLSVVERAFPSLKTVDLKVRPIYHYAASRVRAHVFLCMLAYYVEWHMRQRLKALLFDDEVPEVAEAARASVVAPAEVSPSAQDKARRKRTASGESVHSFRTLLDDLATIAKNRVVAPLANAEPFDLITVVSRFVSWNPHGNSPVCSVDELPGMTKQSEKRSKPVPSPFS